MELYLGSKSPKPARTVQLDLWQLVSLKKRKRSPGKYLLSLSLSVLSDSLRPMGCSLSGFSVHWILACVVIPFSRASSQPRDWICLLHWQADSLPLNHQGSAQREYSRRLVLRGVGNGYLGNCYSILHHFPSVWNTSWAKILTTIKVKIYFYCLYNLSS